MVCLSRAKITDWPNQLLRDWLIFKMVFISKPSEVNIWYLFMYTVIYLCCSVVDHLSVVHFFILTFSLFLFSLSILFHDWQRAFLVNQSSLTWFQPHFKPYSSSSPHCSPRLSLSFLPSTFLLLCYHLLADGQNSALIRLGLNAYWQQSMKIHHWLKICIC